MVIKVSDYVTQIAIDVATLKVSGRSLLDRTGQTWDSWVRLDNFGCSTVSELASLLGADGVRNVSTSVLDANALTTAGTYTLSGSSQNIPESALCILTVKSLNASEESSSNEVSQTVYYRANGQIYHRTRHEGTWSTWSRVDNFGCGTLAELKAALNALP